MTDLNMKEIGERIYKLRASRNMSQLELAVISGNTQGTIQKVESGQVNTRVITMARIAQGLGVTMDYLVFGGGADVDVE